MEDDNDDDEEDDSDGEQRRQLKGHPMDDEPARLEPSKARSGGKITPH